MRLADPPCCHGGSNPKAEHQWSVLTGPVFAVEVFRDIFVSIKFENKLDIVTSEIFFNSV